MTAHALKQPTSFDAGATLARIARTPTPAIDFPLSPRPDRPSQAEAEAAVRTLIRWTGEDADREGLLDTPARVARSYRELFAGYGSDPREHLARTFEEVGGYDELIVLRDIRFVSFCEHHMLPVVGRAHVGYLPNRRVVGLQACAGGRRLRPTPPDSGKDDGGDRHRGPGGAGAPGGRRRHRGRAQLHDAGAA